MTSFTPGPVDPSVANPTDDRYNEPVIDFRQPAACRRVLCAALGILAGASSGVRAELVVFSDGRVVKAASTKAAGDSLEIRLPGGGSYSVDRARIERIVEDEVELSAMPAPRPEQAQAVRPQARPSAVAAPPQQVMAPMVAPARGDDSREKQPKTHGSRNGGGKHGKSGH